MASGPTLFLFLCSLLGRGLPPIEQSSRGSVEQIYQGPGCVSTAVASVRNCSPSRRRFIREGRGLCIQRPRLDDLPSSHGRLTQSKRRDAEKRLEDDEDEGSQHGDIFDSLRRRRRHTKSQRPVL